MSGIEFLETCIGYNLSSRGERYSEWNTVGRLFQRTKTAVSRPVPRGPRAEESWRAPIYGEMVSVIPQLPRSPVENGIHSVILPSQRNSFRPKKKLTRVVNGLSNNQHLTKQFNIPPELFWTSKRNSKKHNFTIPRIVIEKIEDERPWDFANSPRRKMASFTRPGLNCNKNFLHPSYTVCAAVSANDPGALKNIILSGAVNIDQLCSNGASALHEAAYDGKVDCVIALLQCGADVNNEDGEGWTPLHAAVCGQSIQCAELLVRRGANVKAKTDDGLSPLAIATQQKDTEMIKLLTLVSNQPHKVDKPKRSYKQAKEFFVPIFV